MNIYISGLNFSTTDADLNDLFSEYGEVSSARIITDRETRRSRGFGFVEMPDDAGIFPLPCFRKHQPGSRRGGHIFHTVNGNLNLACQQLLFNFFYNILCFLFRTCIIYNNCHIHGRQFKCNCLSNSSGCPGYYRNFLLYH